MNKIKRILTSLVVIYTITTIFLTSFAANSTNPNGKGTVSGSGTAEDPFRLVMGEGMIDIYYGSLEDYEGNVFYFEFTGGSYNAANYIVENNTDKGRLRFTLQGTGENYLKVTAEEGLRYLQAGGITYAPNYLEENSVLITDPENVLEEVGVVPETLPKESGEMDVQTPFYNIVATETVHATPIEGNLKEKDLKHITDLGNGYLIDGSSLLTNVSTYGTAYVFSKSNLDYNEAYNLGYEQINELDKVKINYSSEGFGRFTNGTDLSEIEKFTYDMEKKQTTQSFGETWVRVEKYQGKYKLSGPVRVIYTYEGTSSEGNDSTGETASALEKLLSKIFMSVVDRFVSISGIGGTGGEAYVTIDSLVFNEYPNTVVDFFGETGFMNEKAQTVISIGFKVFKAWAIVIYIILLIYIGIKTMLVTGTPEQKKVKGMIEGWIVGLFMLFCLPYLFKYLIVINDMVVDIIRTNSKYSIYAYYTFSDMYEKWGHEDGEDSTTSVIDRLRNAEKELEKEVNTLESELDGMEAGIEELENSMNDIENSEDWAFVENNIVSNREGLEITANNQILVKNGEEMSPAEIEQELMNKVNAFYSNEENRIEYVEGGAIKHPDELKQILNDYSKEFKAYYKSTGDEVTTYIDITQGYIYNLGLSYADKHTMDLTLEAMKNELIEKEEELENKKQEQLGLETAIEKTLSNDADIMGEMRARFGKTSRFVYVVVLAILVFEVILLLILYYKRLFMLAILIAIFPLVTVAYVFERTRGEDSKIFKNWLQEYTTNVFIQSIHAILYVTLVEVGYSVYIDNNDNIVIFILAVTALITAEPLLKHLLGLRGSTVVDLAKSGATVGKTLAAGAAIGTTFIHTKKDLENIETKSKNKEAKVKNKQTENDKRLDTLRRAHENRINNNSKLSAEQKQRKIATWKNVHNTTDKFKEGARKTFAAKRRLQKRAAQLARISANATAAVGAVAGGIAAGGDTSDFISAAQVANALTGTNGKVSLSPEAKKAEKDNVKVQNNVGNVSTETPTTTSTTQPNYSGSSYDDYSYSGGRGGAGGSADDIENSAKPKVPTIFKPIFRQSVAKRLEEEKIFVDKKYNIHEENEKK